MLAARVLRIQTEDEFNALRDQFIADAKALHAKGLMGTDSRSVHKMDSELQ
jgi:hypothetical protein